MSMLLSTTWTQLSLLGAIEEWSCARSRPMLTTDESPAYLWLPEYARMKRVTIPKQIARVDGCRPEPVVGTALVAVAQ